MLLLVHESPLNLVQKIFKDFSRSNLYKAVLFKKYQQAGYRYNYFYLLANNTYSDCFRVSVDSFNMVFAVIR